MIQGFKKKIDMDGIEKSKVKHIKEGTGTWEPTKRAYLNDMNRNNCSTVFKARTRMLEIKENYRKMHRTSNRVCESRQEFVFDQVNGFVYK